MGRGKVAATVAAGLVLAGLAAWTQHREQHLPAEATADAVLVEKSARRLTLFRQGQILKVYAVALGRHPVGPKSEEGDGRTPEGRYLLRRRNPKGASIAHMSLEITYPGEADAKAARARGARPGGDVMVHGAYNGMGWLGNAHRLADWTRGCVAVTNWEVEEIWRAVPRAVPIEIRP